MIDFSEDEQIDDASTFTVTNSKDKFIFDYLLKQKWQTADAEADYSSGEELSDRKYRKGECVFFMMRKLILSFF